MTFALIRPLIFAHVVLSSPSSAVHLPIMRLLSLLSSFCLSSLLVTAAFTFNSSTFNPHDLIALPRVSGSIASPSGSHLLTSVSQSGNTTLYLTDLARRNDKGGYEHVIVRKGKGESVWLGDEMIAFLEGDELRMVEVSKGGKVSSVRLLPNCTSENRSVRS
jgi:hypothetical protein